MQWRETQILSFLYAARCRWFARLPTCHLSLHTFVRKLNLFSSLNQLNLHDSKYRCKIIVELKTLNLIWIFNWIEINGNWRIRRWKWIERLSHRGKSDWFGSTISDAVSRIGMLFDHFFFFCFRLEPEESLNGRNLLKFFGIILRLFTTFDNWHFQEFLEKLFEMFL